MIDKTKIRAALQSSGARKYERWFVVAVVSFGILGFLALPPLVKSVATDKLSEALHRPVSIGKVAINPFALTLEVDDLDIRERDRDVSFAGFGKLYVNLGASSLFRWGPVIDEIRLVDPKLKVVRLAGNRYNFSDLLDEFAAGPKEGEGGPMPAFSLNNIQVSGGTLEFDDRVIGEEHRVENIALALPFVSSMDYATDILVEPHFSALVDGTRLDLRGKSKPFAESRESEFTLHLNDMRLPVYFAYLPARLPMKLESGTLDADLKLVFGKEPEKAPHLFVSGTASVRDLKATGPTGQDLAAFRRLDLVLAMADVFGGRLAIDEVALDSPEVVVRVNQQGRIDWLDLLPGEADSGKPAERPAPALTWSLGEVRISGGTLRWDDASNAKAFHARIEGLDALVKNLDGQGAVADFEAAWAFDGGESLKVEAVAVKDGKLDLARQRLRIGEVRLKDARASIARSAEGKIEWIAPPALRSSASASTPWTVEVDKSVGEGIAIRFEDAAVSPKAVQNIERLGFELSGVSSEAGRTADVKMAFRLNRKGEVAVDGKLGLLPLNADLNMNVKNIELPPLQAYFSEKLNIDVARGSLSLGGKARLRQRVETSDARGAKRAPEDASPDTLTGGFTGQITIGDFQAVEKPQAFGDAPASGKAPASGAKPSDFLHWRTLRLGKIDARLGPASLAIGEIALADFFARVIVSPRGELNLLKIVRANGETEADAEAGAPPAESPEGRATAPIAVESGPVLPVTIDRITLRGGSVRFTDNFVKPNYTANLGGVSGRVVGLSSKSGTQAVLELRGSYDKVAPLSVSARINPLSEKPTLDLRADLKDIDLTSLSAYSGKYAGYAIEKGKLSLFVKYKIENDRLEAENRVFLDQLTFGDTVDSPDATTLPVRLAVSLLKNRAGEIDVNLPISGSLDDPQFSVGGLILQVLVNLLTKAATSPFALIGSMFGGEELSEVTFDSGHAALTPEAVGRLENLARALIDRPELKFEIEGQADPDQDGEGIKRAHLERRLRALKREDVGERDEGKSSARAVEITKEEYPGLLERAYRAENLPEERGAERPPVEEMERRFLDHAAVGENDLKNLGDRRARAIRDWLVAHAVADERIFLLPSKVGAAEEGKSGRRAQFSLK
ncbi:MAG: DUF748 domain-containing protein [Candidatus Accumulibacter sp.]|jgi:uncharacterized protein involved in outer membrane biogenesis|nr:DUF748 domain-containing protein [Accumulibacter sp.]